MNQGKIWNLCLERKMLVFLILSAAWLTAGQFTSEEIAEDRRWEDFLRTAAIKVQEQMETRDAVTNPWKLTLEEEGTVRNALWKNVKGKMKGFQENWKWEIAAYRLDRLLGLNMVPPTVEREFQGERGSCQLWVDSMMNMRKKNSEGIPTPADKALGWMRSGYLQQAFDNLISNEDRHQGNVLITSDWRPILIDHSRTFRTEKRFTERLLYVGPADQPPLTMVQLPRAFVDIVKALDFNQIRNAVGEYLTDKEIKAILIRRDLVLKEIERAIQAYGEDKVLY